MAIPSTTDPDVQVRYSSVAIALHWALALLLVFQVAMGFAMPHQGPFSFTPMQLHKSVGILILLLTLARLAWRLGHRPPPGVEHGFNGLLAKAVHWGFYAVLLLGPLTGWAIVSTARLKIPTLLFGVVPWPHLPLPGSIGEPTEEVHEWLGWLAIVLFLLHVAGALRHQFLLRDGLLKRMAPGGSVAAVLALLAASVVLYFGTGSYIAGKYLVPAMAAFRQQRVAQERPAPAALSPSPAATPSPEASPTPEATESAAAVEAGLPPVWAIQRGGRLGFSVDNGGSALRGSFKDWSGTITFDPERPDTADIVIRVALASASLGDATQDEMLQGSEFFGSAANPTATWRSTSVRKTGPNRYSAQGTLSLRGASKPQSLSFSLAGEGLRRHVEGSASIDRGALGIGSGESGQSLAPRVALSFAFDATGRAP